jgi:hypothetical protein
VREVEYIIGFLAVVILGIVFAFLKQKNKPVRKTNKANSILEGKKLVLPKIEVSEEIDQYVKSLIDFVYADGVPPRYKILSKENQYNILCQIFSLDIDFAKNEPFVQSIYENTGSKVNTYATIEDKEEWYSQLHFAFEETVADIIKLSADKSVARDCFKGLDNLTDRLLQMDGEKFKDLFFRLRGYHFWYVYNQDEKYKYTLEQMKNRLKIYHGIKQTEFYKKCPEKKDDVSYVLYFAEKANEIVRKEDGRTFRLYLPEENPDEIPPYEYSLAAASDGDFDYKNYWKDIEKVLKKNDGILQTEFYTKFTWSSAILTRSLRDAEKDGRVLREKSGNTYILHMPKSD